MVALFALAFLTPWTRHTFELPLTAVWSYGVAAVFIAVAWPLLELGSRAATRWHRRVDPIERR
jgi:hypothetical protein